tara:strand:+ start:3461 stop:3748 length:288 start_codon:yes stop_codon:yes gene_type:complete
MKITVDKSIFKKRMKKLDQVPNQLMRNAFTELKDKTPVRSGNARNKTKLRRNTIRSDYPYAGRLDEGWSKQAPKGFTEPTLEFMDKNVDKLIKRI